MAHLGAPACPHSRYPTSVSAMAFSPDTRLLAVASSYAYENVCARSPCVPPGGTPCAPADAASVLPSRRSTPTHPTPSPTPRSRQGDVPHEPDSIYIRPVSENEVKPKTKPPAPK